MNKYKKPSIIEGRLGKNPFLLNLKITVNTVASKDKFKHHAKDDVWMPAEQEWETTPFTRIYCDSARRMAMVVLSSRGKDLLLWLIYEAEVGKDYLWLNKVRYMEESKVSSVNTYKTALNELISEGYIANTVIKDVFWINPDYFFNGNRVRYFPNNIVKK